MMAVLDQHPMSMMAKTGTPPKYIAIAAHARMECVPTLPWWMQSLFLPHAMMPLTSTFSTILLVMCSMQPRVQTAETGVSSVAPV